MHINNRIPHLHPVRYTEDSDEIRQSRKHIQSVLTLPVPPEMISEAGDRIEIEGLEEKWIEFIIDFHEHGEASTDEGGKRPGSYLILRLNTDLTPKEILEK